MKDFIGACLLGLVLGAMLALGVLGVSPLQYVSHFFN